MEHRLPTGRQAGSEIIEPFLSPICKALIDSVFLNLSVLTDKSYTGLHRNASLTSLSGVLTENLVKEEIDDIAKVKAEIDRLAKKLESWVSAPTGSAGHADLHDDRLSH